MCHVLTIGVYSRLGLVRYRPPTCLVAGGCESGVAFGQYTLESNEERRLHVVVCSTTTQLYRHNQPVATVAYTKHTRRPIITAICSPVLLLKYMAADGDKSVSSHRLK